MTNCALYLDTLLLNASLGVPASAVKVTGVVDVPVTLRHLLAATAGVVVEFSITTADASAAQAVVTQVQALAAQPATFSAALVAAGVPTTGVTVAPEPVLKLRAQASKEAHFLDASSASVKADGAVDVADSGSAAAAVQLSLSGRASVVNYAFNLEGSPSADDAHINGIRLTGLLAPISGGIAITMRASYTIHATSSPLVAGFSDNHYRCAARAGMPVPLCCSRMACACTDASMPAPSRVRLLPNNNSHLFNLGGVVAVLHGDKLWMGNTNGGSVNCAEGWLLSGGNASEPVWPADTVATLTLSVLPDGTIGPLLINGAAPLIAPSAASAVPAVSGCKPLSIAADAHLFVGASGNDSYNDNFAFSFSPM
jgi:hypothetical protein